MASPAGTTQWQEAINNAATLISRCIATKDEEAESLRSEIGALRKEIFACIEQRSQLQQQLNMERNTSDRLLLEAAQAEQKLIMQIAELESQQVEERNAAEVAKQTLQEQIAELESQQVEERTAAELEKHVLQEQAASLHDEIHSLTMNIFEQGMQIYLLERLMNMERNTIVDLEWQRGEERLVAEVAKHTLQEQVASARAEIRALEEELDEQCAECVQAEDEWEAERRASNRLLVKTETALWAEVQALRGKIAVLESERGEEIGRDRKKKAKQDNGKLQQEVKQLHSLVDDARLRIKDLETRMAQMTAAASMPLAAPDQAPPTCEDRAQLKAEVDALLQRSVDIRNQSQAAIRGGHETGAWPLLDQTRQLLAELEAHAGSPTPDLAELVTESERTLTMFR